MTTVTKTPVKPTWPASKVQEEAARMAASHLLAAYQVIAKQGEPALKEYQAAARQFKVAYLKGLGVKNALELATAAAELEANLYGSQIEIAGDEKSATLTYSSCAMWNAIKKLSNMTPQEEEKMGSSFQTCMQDLASEFGLNAKVQFEGQSCAVTFAK